jgi:hypothetical protein
MTLVTRARSRRASPDEEQLATEHYPLGGPDVTRKEAEVLAALGEHLRTPRSLPGSTSPNAR